MATDLVWKRGYIQDLNPHELGSINRQVLLPAGTTLRRLRFSFKLATHQDAPFSGLPTAQVILGAYLLDGSPIPDEPTIFGDPDAEWLWFEGFNPVTTEHTIVAGTYATMENDPALAVIDVKAQRRFVADNPYLLFVFGQSHNATFQPLYTFQVTFSALFEVQV